MTFLRKFVSFLLWGPCPKPHRCSAPDPIRKFPSPKPLTLSSPSQISVSALESWYATISLITIKLNYYVRANIMGSLKSLMSVYSVHNFACYSHEVKYHGQLLYLDPLAAEFCRRASRKRVRAAYEKRAAHRRRRRIYERHRRRIVFGVFRRQKHSPREGHQMVDFKIKFMIPKSF